MKIGLSKSKSAKSKNIAFGTGVLTAIILELIMRYVPLHYRDNVAYVTAMLGTAGIVFAQGDDTIASIVQGMSGGMATTGGVRSSQALFKHAGTPQADESGNISMTSKALMAFQGYDVDKSSLVANGMMASPSMEIDSSLWNTALMEDTAAQKVAISGSLPGYKTRTSLGGY